ncbi:hypothetical protein BKA66DRAFT_428855 [Pyrenochaeta sp. MPI-SDFR-AT-0127]|nr:hypothetical protein BKA66DRAFT_428855 [Pyrenochaeta sp. MPI-SDFR-AT-0127]
MSSNPTNTAPVKRACDSDITHVLIDNCHRQKVKYIGEGTAPYKNYVSAGLIYTYKTILQKKGLKGS